jgi:hypothetical protein
VLRTLVWQLHGATEALDSPEYLAPENANSGLIDSQKQARELLNRPLYASMLEKIKNDRRVRIRKGRENHVLHDEEILLRRGIRLDAYRFWRKTLSNFAHFSLFSDLLMMQTNSDWKNSWKSFNAAAFCVANFGAEAVAVFIETFPATRRLLTAQEQAAIAHLKSWLRSDDSK